MGIVSKIFSWIDWQPESNGTVLDWTAGLVLVLLVSLLWTRVVHQVIEA